MKRLDARDGKSRGIITYHRRKEEKKKHDLSVLVSWRASTRKETRHHRKRRGYDQWGNNLGVVAVHKQQRSNKKETDFDDRIPNHFLPLYRRYLFNNSRVSASASSYRREVFLRSDARRINHGGLDYDYKKIFMGPDPRAATGRPSPLPS